VTWAGAKRIMCFQALCDDCGWHTPIVEDSNWAKRMAEFHNNGSCPAKPAVETAAHTPGFGNF
jgi:hypothetical protein